MAPASLIANVKTKPAEPVTVMVPDRGSGEGLAAAVKETEPLPIPVAPVVMAAQLALLTADQEQPVPAVTVRLPVPPLAGIEELVGAMEYVQVAPIRGTWN